MANPPIARGNKITAAQFNELVALYHTHWSDDNPGLTHAELLADQSADNIKLHATGWGQLPVEPTVVQTELITSTQTNRLINQINAGLFHVDSTNFNLTSLTKYAAGSIVLYETYKEKIEVAINYLNSLSLYVDYVYGSELVLDDGIGLPYTENVEWTTQTSATVKATFSSYQQARYFFNSGGRIVFDLNCLGYDDWTRVFNNMGTTMVGATTVTASGGWTGISMGGVYNTGTLGAPETVYIFSDYGGDYGGEYGGACGGAYSSRRVYISVEAEELPSGEFEVYFNVTLVDPDGIPINMDITMSAGYLLPIDTPPDSILDSSLGAKFKTDLYSYQFRERETPNLSIYKYWGETYFMDIGYVEDGYIEVL
jgi:hypothetical protein